MKQMPYRLVIGVDNSLFCERVAEFLIEGYELYGDPVLSVDADGRRHMAQAVIWPGSISDYDRKPYDSNGGLRILE